jgi:hypothetical protein
MVLGGSIYYGFSDFEILLYSFFTMIIIIPCHGVMVLGILGLGGTMCHHISIWFMPL